MIDPNQFPSGLRFGFYRESSSPFTADRAVLIFEQAPARRTVRYRFQDGVTTESLLLPFPRRILGVLAHREGGDWVSQSFIRQGFVLDDLPLRLDTRVKSFGLIGYMNQVCVSNSDLYRTNRELAKCRGRDLPELCRNAFDTLGGLSYNGNVTPPLLDLSELSRNSDWRERLQERLSRYTQYDLLYVRDMLSGDEGDYRDLPLIYSFNESCSTT